MLITLIVIISLSLLILGHEAGHFFMAKLFGLKIDEFGFGFPPRIFARKRGETEYSFNWLPFGGFVKIAGENPVEAETAHGASDNRLFCNQPAWKRSVVILAGVTVNFILGWFLISAIFMIGTSPALIVGGVEKGSPADQAGIREGDVFRDYAAAQDFISFINAHRGQPISVQIRRGDSEFAVSITPRVNTLPNQGAIGVSLAEGGIPRENPFAALKDGFIQAILLAWFTILGLFQVISSLILHAQLLPGVVGPVGIVRVAQETAQIGWVYLVQLTALISVSLAAINLMPFPALDGGRFFMIVLEKIKGSPLFSKKTEVLINGIGFAFLLVLIALITVRDIAQWF